MTTAAASLPMPSTWSALVALLTACLKARLPSKRDPRPDAEALFNGPLLHEPHPGSYNVTSLARKRRLRDDIAPHVVAGWVCAAFRKALPGAENLEPEAISDRTGALNLKSAVLTPFVPAREIEPIIEAARAFETACIEAKQRGTSRAKGGKRPQVATTSPARIEEWLTRHRRIHDLNDATFIRERFDEVCSQLEALLARGDATWLARLEPAAGHYLHVFERPELRRRMSALVSDGSGARRNGAGVPPAIRAHALIEGQGMLLLYDGNYAALRENVLTPDVWSGALVEAERAAHTENDAEAGRLVAISRTVFLRLRALVDFRTGGDVDDALDLLARSHETALEARHESLALSTAVDRAAVLRSAGRHQAALSTLLRAKALAKATANDRRLFRILCESADLAHAMANPLLAVAEADRAEAVLDHIDFVGTLLLPTRMHGHWYQPSFRRELAELRERIARSCTYAEAIRGG